MRAWLIAPFALVIATTVHAGGFDKAKFAALTPGTSKDDVVAVVGEPFMKMATDKVFVYRYTYPTDDPNKPKIILATVYFGADDKMTKVDYWSN